MSRTKSLKVEVNPEVLKWSITSSGWDREELISKLKINESIYEGWNKGTINPTIRQLENLSNKTKRPLAAFLLAKPPEEKPTPNDYRMLPDRRGKFERKTIFAIRKARRLQNISKELAINLKDGTKAKIKKVSTQENPQIIAQEYRKLFELTEEKQKKFKDPYKLYNYLRDILEEYNILSFQISMPIEDARGFALADESPGIIVVNSGDMIEARIFTLLHEFGHLLLGQTGISIPDFNTTDTIEKWCNKFAASFLLPEKIAESIFSENRPKLTDTDTLNALSRRYKVSKAMLLYNMAGLKFITNKQFNEILNRYTPKPKLEAKKKKGGGVPADRKCLSEMGNKFVSQVANNIDKNFITYSDALNYLSIKSKNLDKILSKAKK